MYVGLKINVERVCLKNYKGNYCFGKQFIFEILKKHKHEKKFMTSKISIF